LSPSHYPSYQSRAIYLQVTTHRTKAGRSWIGQQQHRSLSLMIGELKHSRFTNYRYRDATTNKRSFHHLRNIPSVRRHRGNHPMLLFEFRLKFSPLRHASEHHVEAVLSHTQTPHTRIREIFSWPTNFVRGCGAHYYFNMTILNKYGYMKMN